MINEFDQNLKIVYFDSYNERKIGDTIYIIESHFLKEGDTVVDKIKNLIKANINEDQVF